MPDFVEPIELCLESLDPAEDEHPYVRCVAMVGGEPGLGITPDGAIVWQRDTAAAALLWVSADRQLIVSRHQEPQSVRLIRAERFLDLPLGKPVVVLHEDVLIIGSHTFRVHVHGIAAVVAPPTRLTLRRAQTFVAAAALVATSFAGCHASTQGQPTVPGGASADVAAPPPPTSQYAQPPPDLATGGAPGVEPASQGGTTAAGTGRATNTKPTPPIQVREHPPAPVRMPND